MFIFFNEKKKKFIVVLFFKKTGSLALISFNVFLCNRVLSLFHRLEIIYLHCTNYFAAYWNNIEMNGYLVNFDRLCYVLNKKSIIWFVLFFYSKWIPPPPFPTSHHDVYLSLILLFLFHRIIKLSAYYTHIHYLTVLCITHTL